MVNPAQHTGPTQAPLNPLNSVDKRAEVLLSQSLENKQPSSHPALFPAIRRVQQLHPEMRTPLDTLLQQFGSLTLNCHNESIQVNGLAAQEISPVLKVMAQGQGPSYDLSDFAPRTIQLVLQLFENKKIEKEELLIHAAELLAISNQLQIDQVTQALIATKTEFTRLTPEDFTALLVHARKHNFTFYISLLCHAASEPQLKEKLTQQELDIVNDEQFKNISSGRQITIRLHAAEATTLYAKMCAARHSELAEGLFAAIICPPRAKTVSFLKEVKRTFNVCGWPNQVRCVSIKNDQALIDFFASPENSRQLTALHLISCEISDHIGALLPKGIQLKELVVNGCQLSNHGAQSLAHYLSTCTALQTLSIEKNRVKAVGLSFITSSLAGHANVSTLNLSKNELDMHAIDELRKFSGQTLILSKNPLGDAGAEKLASILQEPHTIEHLDLSECAIADAGISAICRALCLNPLLYSLHLNANDFTSDATRFLYELLANGITLTHLDLTKAHLTSSDICTLIEPLRRNQQLARLTLAETEVTDEVAQRLSTMLQENKALTSLSVRATKITDKGAQLLVAAIEAKEQFELSLAFNALSDSLKATLRQNPKILLG